MFVSARIGILFCKTRTLEEDTRQDFGLIVSATLTLLGLIIGFTFSMAISRYDQRKNYEEEEANAIGTEYVRADLLPSINAEKARTLLRDYLDQRVLFYKTRDDDALRMINVRTAQLQTELWSVVRTPPGAQTTAVDALTISGMNDLLNSQGYTQAAWWNQIPLAAWLLMVAVAVCCNLLVGYYSHRAGKFKIRLLLLPLVLSIAFFAIADIDSPRRGVIRVFPQNLVSLVQSLGGQ